VVFTLVVAKVVNSFAPVPLQPQPGSVAVATDQQQVLPPDPSKVRIIAQLSGSDAVRVIDGAAAPVPQTCSETPPVEPEESTEACQDASVDIASYINPSCGGAGQSCGVIAASSVTLTDSYIGNVTNEVIDLGGGLIKQRSNDIFFLYKREGGYVSLLQDTIWGGGPAGGFFTCDGTTQEAFYRVYDGAGPNANWGNKQYPESATCGAVFTSTGALRTFKKVSDTGLDINSPSTQPDIDEGSLTSCNVSGQTGIPSGNASKLIFQGPAVCNDVEFDMMAVQIVAGAGLGEVNMYCKDKNNGQGKGLCAFYQTLDPSKPENRPTSWTSTTDICALKSGGSRATLPTYFEYNIQRECGQTPVKVLNNFMDEYSVSCMPESDYVLEIVRQAQCGQTGIGCAPAGGWNASGDLNFSASGKLFGLFRNESAIDARYNTMNGLRDKNRQESIEAYLTAKVDKIPLSGQGSSTQTNNFNTADKNSLSAYQSPVYKLSTLQQQCDLVYDKLVAVKELCEPFNRIEGQESEECAINQFLPNTSTRYVDMIDAMKNPADPTKSRCLSLMNPAESNQPAKNLRDQILDIDPAMEVAYRPAFIVVASYVGDPDALNPQFVSQTSTGEKDPSNFWQVDYLEVKVPTFGSDFLERDHNQSASNKARAGSTYRDPLRFMGDLMTTPDLQELYRQEEENDRNAIRSKAASIVGDTSINAAGLQNGVFDLTKFLTPGEVIGLGQKPIKCRAIDGSGYSTEACDNIAKALITFINSSTVVPVSPGEGPNGSSLTRQYSPPRGWLPASKCEVFEKNLYGNSLLTQTEVPKEYQVAEQANTIGSKLDAQDVGQYNDKHKVAETKVITSVPDLNGGPAASNFGHTQVFFISPHNYTLLYAQNSMLAMLTLEQREAFLKNENFNSVLKTTGLDKFVSAKQEETYWTAAGTGENGPLVPSTTIGAEQYTVSLDMKRRMEDGKELDSPLMWQVAGSVANIPTRVFTFVTEKIGSPMYNFTLGCTGANATENWLLGNCKPVSPTNPGATPIPTDTDPSNTCVQVYVDDTAANDAERYLTDNIMSQQHQSAKFAGWDRYYSVADRPQDQHLFYPDCQGGQYCYSYILNSIKDRINGKRINPYLIMAIAMNKTGGLISNKPGFVGPHFGCGLGGSGEGGQIISDGAIESKLNCVMDFFERNSSLSEDAALKRYGYTNGIRENNLTKIVGILSGFTAPTTCPGTNPNGPQPTEE